MTEIRDFEFTLTRRRWALPSRKVVAHVRRGPQSTTLYGRDSEDVMSRVVDVTRAWFGPLDSLRLWDGILEAAERLVASGGDRLTLEVPR